MCVGRARARSRARGCGAVGGPGCCRSPQLGPPILPAGPRQRREMAPPSRARRPRPRPAPALRRRGRGSALAVSRALRAERGAGPALPLPCPVPGASARPHATREPRTGGGERRGGCGDRPLRGGRGGGAGGNRPRGRPGLRRQTD